MAASQWPRDRVGCSGEPWRWSPQLLEVGSDRRVHYPVGLEFPSQRCEIPGDGALAQIYSAPWALRITAVSNIILVAIVAGRLRFAKRINADHQSRKMKTYPE